jgi:hypothetical protein
MRTYWSAVFSNAFRVRRASFEFCRGIVRPRTRAGFTSKTPAGPERGPTSEYLSQLSDALAAFQEMSDRRRLGIKNEAEGYGLIALTQGKIAIVDAEDFERLNRYRWCACKCKGTYYAVRVEHGRTVRMHREIMRAPKGMLVDHADHNGLNNRKSNLRLCTNAQNSYNQQANANGTSRYKGVSWHKCSRKWSARVRCDGKFYNLGDYKDEIEAAKAYDRKARELFGEFACLNFPERMEKNE